MRRPCPDLHRGERFATTRRMKRFALVAIVVATGCGKASDIGPMQDEANGIAHEYREQLDGLKTRFAGLRDRRAKVGQATLDSYPDGAAIVKLETEVEGSLRGLESFARNAPLVVGTAAKSENPRPELIKKMGEIHDRLTEGVRDLNTRVDTLESFLTYLEVRPAGTTAAAPAAPAPAEAPATEENPAPPPG